MLRTAFCALTVAGALAGSAHAGECSARIELTEAAMAAAGLERAGDSPDRWSSDDGEATLVVPDGGVAPRENWFGEPVAPEQAWRMLDDARSLDRDGDLAGCLARLEELTEMLDLPG